MHIVIIPFSPTICMDHISKADLTYPPLCWHHFTGVSLLFLKLSVRVSSPKASYVQRRRSSVNRASAGSSRCITCHGHIFICIAMP